MKTFLWTLYSLFARPELWASGTLLCLVCGEEHVGTWPVGREPFSCPYCLDDNDGLCVPWDGLGFAPDDALARFGKNPG